MDVVEHDDPCHPMSGERACRPRQHVDDVGFSEVLYDFGCMGFGGREEEGNVLFNDALNTFYLRLYGVEHMAKDHSDSERGNLQPPHGLLFPINSKGFLYAPSHREDSTYHGLCYTRREVLAGTRNSSMGPPRSIDPTTHRTISERSYQGWRCHLDK